MSQFCRYPLVIGLTAIGNGPVEMTWVFPSKIAWLFFLAMLYYQGGNCVGWLHKQSNFLYIKNIYIYIHIYLYIYIYTYTHIYIYIHHKRYSYWSSVSPTNRDFLATDPVGAPGRGRHQRGVIASKGDVPMAAEPRDPGGPHGRCWVSGMWWDVGFIFWCWAVLGMFWGWHCFTCFTFWRFSLTFSLNNSKLEALLRKTASWRIRAKGQDFKTLFFLLNEEYPSQ